MGLIIKDKITQLKKGYPTVSDKYNVSGGILSVDSEIAKFGDIVVYTDIPGNYKKLYETDSPEKIAGIILATNVKLSDTLNDDVEIKPGEAFDLLVSGYVAVPLASDSTLDKIKEGERLSVNLSERKFTTLDKFNKLTNKFKFTGIYEIHNGELVAEILIK